MQKHYETLFVLKPTLTDEETAVKIAQVRETLENNGAQIVATQNVGTRKLAYDIDKHQRGYYCIFYHTAPTTAIKEVERLLRINEEVIKFFTLKYEKKKEIAFWEKASAKLAPKAEVKASEE
jgi:small subunit ribosomal protein S6